MMNGRLILRWATVSLVLLAVAAGPVAAQSAQTKPGKKKSTSMEMMSGKKKGMSMMMGMDASKIPRVPPVAGYAEGRRIFFIHTEVSDPKIGRIMTDMMNSPVPVVPSLAAAGEDMVASVWAFTNGVRPKGPRGPLDFQPDVFDHPVGSDGYRPLRRIHLVTWAEGARARLLKSAREVRAAMAAGEVAVERTDVVVNMPFLTWPGGKR